MARSKAHSEEFRHDEGLHFKMMPINHLHRNYAHIPVQSDMKNTAYEDITLLPGNLPLRTTPKSQKSCTFITITEVNCTTPQLLKMMTNLLTVNSK
jgi:hypothetical protein